MKQTATIILRDIPIKITETSDKVIISFNPFGRCQVLIKPQEKGR